MEKILVVHNAYQQSGGEDSVVASEIELLRANGHDVHIYSRHNDELRTIPLLTAGRDTIWSARTVSDIAAGVAKFSPDVIHVHNTFPLVSPSLYWAASWARIPIIQTLHNFRLLCPQAMFLRQGKVCEDCLSGFPWSAIRHRCYRNSRVQSGILAAMLGVHRMIGTYREKVTRYIALNHFCRGKFIDGGLPAEKISVKPNFVKAPGVEQSLRQGGLFVGRLSVEKGISILLLALDSLLGVMVQVIGAGPELSAVSTHGSVRCLGWLERDAVYKNMMAANYLIFPSICYESFGLVVIEAFAASLPVIAGRFGAMAEIVRDGQTGLLFEPGSATDLARVIAWAESHPEEMRKMGINARREYEAKYTPETNYRQLMEIYAEAVEAEHGGGTR